jgi:hypothetical protein
VAEHHDLEIALAADPDDHAEQPTQSPVQQAHRHDAQSEPAPSPPTNTTGSLAGPSFFTPHARRGRRVGSSGRAVPPPTPSTSSRPRDPFDGSSFRVALAVLETVSGYIAAVSPSEVRDPAPMVGGEFPALSPLTATFFPWFFPCRGMRNDATGRNSIASKAAGFPCSGCFRDENARPVACRVRLAMQSRPLA